MTTATTRKPSSRRKPAAPRPNSTKPYLRFFHSADLRKRTLALLDKLESADDATAHRDALADLVAELTNTGLDYYFLGPLKLAKAGFIVERSAGLGMAGVQRVMSSVIRNIIGHMERPQLLSVCGSIRQLML